MRLKHREKAITWLAAAGVGIGMAVGRPAPPADAVAGLRLERAVVAAPAVREFAVPRLSETPAVPRKASVVLAPSEVARAREAVRAQVAARLSPGAALAVGRRDQVVLEEGFGRVGWTAGADRVDPQRTVYDVASLTKVAATTTAAMLLWEDGRLDLKAPVSRYLPGFAGGGKERVTIRHLLTHTSGLPAGASLAASDPEKALAKAAAVPLRYRPGTETVYSDVGFVVLWAALESAAGEPLYPLLDRRVYGPLKMRSTTFLPGEGCPVCAPTARAKDGAPVQGRVHDPMAWQLGGIAGNAGLFSTVHDLGRFAAMLANGGELEGTRVFSAETVRHFAERQAEAENRALGWASPGPDGSGGAGRKLSKRAFGHTGFTGTSLWIDPDRGSWTVLLTNRVYEAKGPNRIMALRRAVNDRVAEASDRIDAEIAVGQALAD